MIRVIDIAQIVCFSLDVDIADVMADRRHHRTVETRQLVMYLAKEVLDLSFQDIGKQLGGLHHTTVMHGFQKVAAEIATDSRLKDLVGSLKATLEYRTTLEALGQVDPLAAARRIAVRPRRGAIETSTFELAALAVFTLDLWEIASCAEAMAQSIQTIDLPEPHDAELPRLRALSGAILDEMNHIAGAPSDVEPAQLQGEQA